MFKSKKILIATFVGLLLAQIVAIPVISQVAQNEHEQNIGTCGSLHYVTSEETRQRLHITSGVNPFDDPCVNKNSINIDNYGIASAFIKLYAIPSTLLLLLIVTFKNYPNKQNSNRKK